MSSYHNYSLVEPHLHATSPYVHTARGGAGNIAKATSPPQPTTTAPRASANTKRPGPFASGRGGAGNIHQGSERAIFSFDEELERQMRQQEAMAPVYHVGRGGAGNMMYTDSSTAGRTETASARSTSSAESGADYAARGVRRSLEKSWAKVVEHF